MYVPLSRLDPSSPSTRFLAYWLLMGVPWPRRIALSMGGVQPDALPLLSALGAVFDALNVRPNRLRRWAYDWLSWSEDALVELAASRTPVLATVATGGGASLAVVRRG